MDLELSKSAVGRCVQFVIKLTIHPTLPRLVCPSPTSDEVKLLFMLVHSNPLVDLPFYTSGSSFNLCPTLLPGFIIALIL